MKLLILGGTGMLGHRLWASLGKKHDVYATIRKESYPTLEKYHLPGINLKNSIFFDDLLNQEALFQLLNNLKPDYVINCIGIIKQIKESKNHLDKDGIILIVFSTLTGDVESLIKKYGYKFELLEEKSLFFEKLKALKLTFI